MVMVTFRGMYVEECFCVSILAINTELDDKLDYN